MFKKKTNYIMIKKQGYDSKRECVKDFKYYMCEKCGVKSAVIPKYCSNCGCRVKN